MQIGFPFVDFFSERIAIKPEVSGHFQLTLITFGTGAYQRYLVEIEVLSIIAVGT